MQNWIFLKVKSTGTAQQKHEASEPKEDFCLAGSDVGVPT